MKLAIICAALLLAGCASAGTNFSDQAVASVQPGMSKADVIAMLGPPNAVSTMPDGRQVLAWSHVKINSWAGSSLVRSASFVFDADGRVTGPATHSNIPGQTSP